MDKQEALYNFWAGFGYPAFEESSVGTGENAPKYPYITYSVISDSFGHDVALTASIWDRKRSGYSASAKNDEKVNQISRAISPVGKALKYDGGVIWLRRGHPFEQSMGDPSDNQVRRKLLNVTAEFISDY